MTRLPCVETPEREAAFDFLVKTEMDKAMLDEHANYQKSVLVLESFVASGNAIGSFDSAHAAEYRSIRGYLNLHELMGVGIRQDVFDDDVCYFFWAAELIGAHAKCRVLIEHIRSLDGGKNSYSELVALNSRWLGRPEQIHL